MQPVLSEESRLKQSLETALWTQAQVGCHQSINLLMSQHNRLVYAVVRQQVLGNLSYEEALQAGRIGLWRAIMGYDPERGISFSTYAWTAIMRSVWAAVKKWARREKEAALVLSLSANARQAEVEAAITGTSPHADTTQEPDKQWEEKALAAATRQAVDQLPTRLQLVLAARYGWDGGKPATFSQIGEQLGISLQRAHQLHQEALLRLRQPACSYQLRVWLGKHTAAEYETAVAATARWRQKRGGRR